MTDAALGVLADPAAAREELVDAFARLGAVEETPGFWTAIIADPRFGSWLRRQCLLRLLERHAPMGAPLREVGRRLDGAPWLRDSNVHLVLALGGKIPVRFTGEDTVAAIEVLPQESEGQLTLYLRIAGRVDRAAVVAGLRGQPEGTDAPLLEYGSAARDG